MPRHVSPAASVLPCICFSPSSSTVTFDPLVLHVPAQGIILCCSLYPWLLLQGQQSLDDVFRKWLWGRLLKDPESGKLPFPLVRQPEKFCGLTSTRLLDTKKKVQSACPQVVGHKQVEDALLEGQSYGQLSSSVAPRSLKAGEM